MAAVFWVFFAVMGVDRGLLFTDLLVIHSTTNYKQLTLVLVIIMASTEGILNDGRTKAPVLVIGILISDIF